MKVLALASMVCAVGFGCGALPGTCPGWTVVHEESDSAFTALYAAEGQVWAFGKGGTSRFDGVAWSSPGEPDAGLISRAGGVGANDIWLTNNSRTIRHFDGGSWTELTLPGTAGGLHVQSSTNVIAHALTGTGAGLYFWNGSAWRAESPPERCTGVWSGSPGQTYCASSDTLYHRPYPTAVWGGAGKGSGGAQVWGFGNWAVTLSNSRTFGGKSYVGFTAAVTTGAAQVVIQETPLLQRSENHALIRLTGGPDGAPFALFNSTADSRSTEFTQIVMLVSDGTAWTEQSRCDGFVGTDAFVAEDGTRYVTALRTGTPSASVVLRQANQARP